MKAYHKEMLLLLVCSVWIAQVRGMKINLILRFSCIDEDRYHFNTREGITVGELKEIVVKKFDTHNQSPYKAFALGKQPWEIEERDDSYVLEKDIFNIENGGNSKVRIDFFQSDTCAVPR